MNRVYRSKRYVHGIPLAQYHKTTKHQKILVFNIYLFLNRMEFYMNFFLDCRI